ncbi:MAG: 30S ribosomal protein S17 [bacterium]|nr:30S ribosomal protein S17 [bacterium]
MKKTLIGKVVSTKMEKTVVVAVERKFRHPKYQKVIIRHKRFKAHNELKDINVDDMVTIQETRPISKDKRFIVINKVAKT